MADESGSNPNSERDRPSSSPSRRTRNPSIPPRLNLLLAEDNFPDALLVRQAIQAEDLPVDIHVVLDGLQAIEFIEKAEKEPDAPRPHLVLLDLNLPRRDGFEVLRRLRGSEEFGSVPVLIVTSSDSPDDKSQAAELGVAYFRKPSNYEEFLKVGAVVKQLLVGRGLL